MPSADPELQDWIIERFGDLDDSPPYQALISTGHWAEVGSGLLVYSIPWKEMTVENRRYAVFLADEWDYSYGPAEGLQETAA